MGDFNHHRQGALGFWSSSVRDFELAGTQDSPLPKMLAPVVFNTQAFGASMLSASGTRVKCRDQTLGFQPAAPRMQRRMLAILAFGSSLSLRASGAGSLGRGALAFTLGLVAARSSS